MVAFHYAPHASSVDVSSPLQLAYLAVLSGGASAVSLFFVLSGFVLAHSYLGYDGAFRGTFRRFWSARARRILPAYLLAYIAALIWLAFNEGVDGPAALASLGLVQAWWGPIARLVNSPGWSLSVEAFFYAVFPFLAARVYRLASRRPKLVICALFIASLPGPMALGALSEALPGPTGAFLAQTALNLPLLHLSSFLIGVATVAAFRRAPGPKGRWNATVGEALPTLGGLCCLILVSGTLPGPLVRNGALAPWFALLIFRLAHGRGFVSQVLSWPVFVLLGEASFALYIIQEPLWNWAGPLLVGADDTLRFAILFGVAIGLSVVIQRVLEPRAFHALDSVRGKLAGPGYWIRRCPALYGKAPSLSG